MNKVLIIGATSSIAEATARLFAGRGARLFLLARNADKLKRIQDDLNIRGAQSVEFDVLDVNDVVKHQLSVEKAITSMGGIDVALIAHGSLPDQQVCEASVSQTVQEMHTNFLSTISLLTLLANVLEKQRSGTIAVISSVAGDRGRQSNYVYGSAKGGISLFMQGLRNRLFQSGVKVITIKPGFVDTPMTAQFKKGLLWAKPESVAKGIIDAIDKSKSEVYLPWFWKYIMLIIKSIPEALFKRLKL